MGRKAMTFFAVLMISCGGYEPGGGPDSLTDELDKEPDSQTEDESCAIVSQRSSSWEDYPSGCPSWWLGLDVSAAAGRLACREVSTTRESSFPSASNITMANGTRVIDANSSCCLSESDEVISVFACECEGEAYLSSQWEALLNEEYDRERVVFFAKQTNSCRR